MSVSPPERSLIIEVEGKSYELDWRRIAVLLALRWVRFNALPLARFQTIETDPGKLRALVEELKAMKLIEEFTVGRSSIIYLTEEGVKVAVKIENIARESRLLQEQLSSSGMNYKV
ncbi:MAG: hypothetical protein QXU62_09035 [Thermofilaceae archaeon]